MTNTAVAGLWGDSPTHPCSSDGDSERCHCGEPFVDEEPAAAQIARLKAENERLAGRVDMTKTLVGRIAGLEAGMVQARRALVIVEGYLSALPLQPGEAENARYLCLAAIGRIMQLEAKC